LLGLRLDDDREHFDICARNIIENPDLVYSQPVLRPGDTPQALDSALAHLGGFMAKMRFERFLDGGLRGRLQLGCSQIRGAASLEGVSVQSVMTDETRS
jgi:hypothetical protein